MRRFFLGMVTEPLFHGLVLEFTLVHWFVVKEQGLDVSHLPFNVSQIWRHSSHQLPFRMDFCARSHSSLIEVLEGDSMV
jgi:hypothetical protein